MAGYYYNPPSPHIGGRQPLEPRRIIPPSGPAPTPPPTRGALIAQAILDAWRPPPPGPYLAQEPYGNELIVPPVSGPAPQNPPFMGGSRVRSEILIAWLPAVPPWRPQAIAVQPPVAASPYVPPAARVMPSWQASDPLPTLPVYPEQPAPVPQFAQLIGWGWSEPEPYPIVLTTIAPASGPVPTPPPVKGARVPDGVLQAWSVPPAAPILGELSTPPSGAAPAYVPPAARVMPSWQAPDQAAQVARDLVAPSGPTPTAPPTKGAIIPDGVLQAWSVPPAAPILGELSTPPSGAAPPYVPPAARVMPSWSAPDPAPQVARDLVPPSGPAPTNPPFMGGASVPEAVLISWLPPAPQPPVTQPGVKQGVAPSAPPLGGGVPAAVMISWQQLGWGVSADLLTPASADRPIGLGLPNAILASWQTAAPAWQPASSIVQQPIAAPYVPPAARIMPSWMAPDPAFQSSVDVDPPRSGPAPSNPPVVGNSPALQAIFASWNVPLPSPVVVNAHIVLGTISLTSNPRYVVGYSKSPIRGLGYPSAPKRNLP